jgi:hypothetical protein
VIVLEKLRIRNCAWTAEPSRLARACGSGTGTPCGERSMGNTSIDHLLKKQTDEAAAAGTVGQLNARIETA